jgi:hypothetical protein
VAETVVDEEEVDTADETSGRCGEGEEYDNELSGSTESRVGVDEFDLSTSSGNTTDSTALVKALYRSNVSTGSGRSRRKALRRPQTV